MPKQQQASTPFTPPATPIKVDLGGTMKYAGDVLELCRISSDLSAEIEQHPGNFAWWGVMTAEAAYQADYLERKTKAIQAELDITIRDQYAANDKKPTEAQLAALIRQHPDNVRIQDETAEAIKTLKICQAVLEAFKTRKDLIVVMANDRRNEAKNLDFGKI